MFFMLCLVVVLKKPVFVLGNIGRNLTLHIYMWHLLVGALIQDLLTYMGAKPWVLDWCLPIATVVATMAISLLFARLASRKKAVKPQQSAPSA
jgi:hypothetical protein